VIYTFVLTVDLKQEIIMKYVKVEWPEIQDYMLNPRYREEVSYDINKNCWFVPEDFEEYKSNLI